MKKDILKIEGIKLIRAEIVHRTVEDYRFIRVKISDTKFEDVDFEHIELEDCSFERCSFINCRFNNCIIDDSKFTDCVSEDCSFDYIFQTGDTRYENCIRTDNGRKETAEGELFVVGRTYKAKDAELYHSYTEEEPEEYPNYVHYIHFDNTIFDEHSFKEYTRDKYHLSTIRGMMLRRMTIKGKNFEHLIIENCTFSNLVFEDCVFFNIHTENSVFTGCQFINCIIADHRFFCIDYQNCVIKDCTHINCTDDGGNIFENNDDSGDTVLKMRILE